MIITGGFNVYSAEVEQVILAHPAVQDCAVIGLPDEKWGERVTAVLQLRPGQAVTADEIRGYVKERLGSVKAPKQVEVWPDLPRSKVGKVLKTDVKAQLRHQPDHQRGSLPPFQRGVSIHDPAAGTRAGQMRRGSAAQACCSARFWFAARWHGDLEPDGLAWGGW
jgi:AMP-binding enzyme C-terminal domain